MIIWRKSDSSFVCRNCSVQISIFVGLSVQLEGQALGYSVRSTTTAPCENVAVPALGNLLCPAKQGCRLSVLKELLHKNKMNCNRLEKILVDSVAYMAVLQGCWGKK